MAEPPVIRTADPPQISHSKSPAPPQPPAPGSLPPNSQSQVQTLLNKRWLMFVTLFLVTAALGIPFLWKSEAFSKREKIFWSIIVSLYTLLIFWIFFKIMAWCYGQITSSLG